jgi:hypothetical protein
MDEKNKEEKREYKEHVRLLLQIAREARRRAEAALEHFREEYSLSEGESDISDSE